LLWRNQASSNGQQYYRLLYATFDGVSWGPEQEVYSASGIYSLRGMPDLDSTGKVHATFLVGSLFSTSIYHNALESTGWSTPVNVPIPSMYIGYETVWPDQKGGVKIYYDTTDDKMHYFHWRNNQFYVNDHQFSGSMGSHDTQLDAQTNLHTFWTSQVPIPGGTTTGIYYQCLNNNFIWGTQQVLSGQNSAGNLHSASDRVSDVAIAWNEANTKIRLGIWRGCNQTDMKTVPLLATNSSLKAVALSPDPKKACVLASRSGYPVNYNVICADINR